MTADVEVASADEGLDRLPLPLLADAWLWLWEPVEWASTSSSSSSVLIADPGAANFSLGIVFPLTMCWMRKPHVVMMSPSRSFLSGLPAPLFFSFLRILPTLVRIFSSCFFALGTSGRGIQLLSNPLPDDVFDSRIQMVPMLFAVELGVVLQKINQHQLIVLFPVVIGDILLRCPNPFLLLDTFFFTRWVCLGVL